MRQSKEINPAYGNLSLICQRGGDLHNHLTGAAYAETFFEIGCRHGLYADLDTGKLYKELSPELDDKRVVRLSETMNNLHSVRMTLIDKWSIRDFQPYKYPLGPGEYFFSLFSLFIAAASKDYLPDLVHELRVRAREENVQYIETIGIAPSVSPIADLSEKDFEAYSNELTKLCAEYNNDPAHNSENLEFFIRKVIGIYDKEYKDQNSTIYQNVQTYIDANKEMASADCIGKNDYLTSRFDTVKVDNDDVMIKYQGYASRDKAPMIVLCQLYIIYKAMTIIPNILVGCNIVAAENSENSMQYYKAHMLMFKVFHEIYNAKTAIHAGELTMGLIPPEHLTYHVTDAVRIAGADRIGHGVDIVFEHNSAELLKEMKEHNIAIEINLTSNEFILGVKGNSHPFMLYKSSGVPMVISTDDPGILRTSLTEEYTIAVYRYDLSYDDVKKIVRNSITYSFLNDTDKKTVMDTYLARLAKFEARYESIPD